MLYLQLPACISEATDSVAEVSSCTSEERVCLSHSGWSISSCIRWPQCSVWRLPKDVAMAYGSKRWVPKGDRMGHNGPQVKSRIGRYWEIHFGTFKFVLHCDPMKCKSLVPKFQRHHMFREDLGRHLCLQISDSWPTCHKWNKWHKRLKLQLGSKNSQEKNIQCLLFHLSHLIPKLNLVLQVFSQISVYLDVFGLSAELHTSESSEASESSEHNFVPNWSKLQLPLIHYQSVSQSVSLALLQDSQFAQQLQVITVSLWHLPWCRWATYADIQLLVFNFQKYPRDVVELL